MSRADYTRAPPLSYTQDASTSLPAPCQPSAVTTPQPAEITLPEVLKRT